MFGILLHVLLKIDNIQEVYVEDSVIICDEIIEVTKNVPKKKHRSKQKHLLPYHDTSKKF